MIMFKEYPIIEFDSESPTVIDISSNIDLGLKLPEHCVISFFGDAVNKKIQNEACPQIGALIMESFEIPIFECYSGNGIKIAFLHGLGGGPYAAGQIEKLHALGCNKYIVCGGCGMLTQGSKVGDLLIPASALRDEGTSYHYIKPSRTIEMNHRVLHKMIDYLEWNGYNYHLVKTWTTDAMYRETVDMIKRRFEEGCQTVEMECASFLAVGQYHNLEIGQLLYAGDDLSSSEWASRDWKKQTDIRDDVLKISIDICGIL